VFLRYGRITILMKHQRVRESRGELPERLLTACYHLNLTYSVSYSKIDCMNSWLNLIKLDSK
jgi:hypothetical protein